MLIGKVGTFPYIWPSRPPSFRENGTGLPDDRFGTLRPIITKAIALYDIAVPKL